MPACGSDGKAQLYPMANGGQGAGGGRRQRSRVTEMRHRCSKDWAGRCRATVQRDRAGAALRFCGTEPVPRGPLLFRGSAPVPFV
uniref:Uncharacterized protein n=1 Tax=Oryza glumipatula TaxID=40148 RepID=A0A0E0A3C2_9ORYZ